MFAMGDLGETCVRGNVAATVTPLFFFLLFLVFFWSGDLEWRFVFQRRRL